MNTNVVEIIQNRMSTLSKGQRAIGAFILENCEKSAYMTAAQLAKNVRLSESTVVRFTYELGYGSYPDFTEALQQHVRSMMTPAQRIELTEGRLGDNILYNVLNSDMKNIASTIEEVDKDAFNNAVDIILNAKTVYIVGARSSSALAEFLSFYFNLILPNVKHIHGASGSEMLEQIYRIDESDALISITFPRYSQSTIRATKYAHTKNSAIIAITDSETSPIAELAQYTLLARSEMASFVDSLVAPLSLINALIVAIGLRRKQDVFETFDRLESFWQEYNVFRPASSEGKEN